MIVVLSGTFDARRRDELDQILDRYGDVDELIFDLEAVESIDTSALRSFVRFQRARRESGKAPLVLASPTPYVRRFLATVGLDRAFDLRDEV